MNFGRRPSARSLASVSSSTSMRMPCVVHLDLHDVGLVGVEARHGAGIRRRLGHDDVAGIEEHAADEVDHLLAAGGDHQVVGLDHGPLGRHHLRRCTCGRPRARPSARTGAPRRSSPRPRATSASRSPRRGTSSCPAGRWPARSLRAAPSRPSCRASPTRSSRACGGEQAAVALDLVGAGGRGALPGSLVYRHAAERTLARNGLPPRPPTGSRDRRGDRHPALLAHAPGRSAGRRRPRHRLRRHGLRFPGADRRSCSRS